MDEDGKGDKEEDKPGEKMKRTGQGMRQRGGLAYYQVS